MLIGKRLSFAQILTALLFCSCEPETITRYITVEYEPHKISCPDDYTEYFTHGALTFGKVAGAKNCEPFFASSKLIPTGNEVSNELSVSTGDQIGDSFRLREQIRLQLDIDSVGYFEFPPSSVDDSFNIYILLNEIGEQEFYILDQSFLWNGASITQPYIQGDVLAGEFQCRFVKASHSGSSIFPDTVLFTECRFEVMF